MAAPDTPPRNTRGLVPVKQLSGVTRLNETANFATTMHKSTGLPIHPDALRGGLAKESAIR